MAAEARASFVVDLETGGVVEGSTQAAKSLGKLSDEIQEGQKELRELQAQMAALKGGASVNVEQFKKLRDSIAAKKDALAKSSGEYTKLGGKLTDLGRHSKAAGEPTRALSDRIGGLGSKLSGMPGPAGAAGSSLSSFAGLLANPYVAVAALTVALVAGAFALAAYGVAATDAARKKAIFRSALVGSDAAGARLGATVKRLAKELPIAGEEVDKIAQSLAEKGLKGNALESALSAVARTTSVLGAGAAAKLDAVITKSKDLKRFTAQALDFTGSGIDLDSVAGALAKRTGTTMAAARESIKAGAVDLATGLQALDDATKAKLGGAADKMNQGLGPAFERAKTSIGEMFASFNIEPLLAGLNALVDLFDSSTASGKAMRTICETMLQPLIDAVAGEGDTIKHWIQDLVIGALVLSIGFFKARNALKAFAKDPIGELEKLVKKMGELGSDMIDGLVDGIKAGAEKVADAVTGVVDDAIAAGKDLLGIKSPSRVFRYFGEMTTAGYVEGLEDGAPDVDGAVGSVFALAPPTFGGGSSSVSSVRGATNVTINITAPAGAGLGEFRAMLLQALEEAGIGAGAPSPEPA